MVIVGVKEKEVASVDELLALIDYGNTVRSKTLSCKIFITFKRNTRRCCLAHQPLAGGVDIKGPLRQWSLQTACLIEHRDDKITSRFENFCIFWNKILWPV